MCRYGSRTPTKYFSHRGDCAVSSITSSRLLRAPRGTSLSCAVPFDFSAAQIPRSASGCSASATQCSALNETTRSNCFAERQPSRVHDVKTQIRGRAAEPDAALAGAAALANSIILAEASTPTTLPRGTQRRNFASYFSVAAADVENRAHRRADVRAAGRELLRPSRLAMLRGAHTPPRSIRSSLRLREHDVLMIVE